MKNKDERKAQRVIVWVVAAGLLFLPSAGHADRKPLRINCTIHSPYEAFFFRLVQEICAQNHIPVERNTPPEGRSLVHVNQGIDDGDGPRIGGLSSQYANMLQVPEPFGEFVFGAFATTDGIEITGWSSLKDLNVAYIHGWKIFDNKVTEAKSVTKVKNKELLFGLLNAGRTDVALITRIAGYAAIKALGFEKIRFIDPPLAVEPNYLYLHKSHEALVPVLVHTLKTMKKDGIYQRLYGEMIAAYLPE